SVFAHGSQQLYLRHRLAVDVAVHEVLISRTAALDDDVVDDGGETGIAEQRQAEGVPLHVAMSALAERDDGIRRERVDDGGHGIDTHRRPASPVLGNTSDRGGRKNSSEDEAEAEAVHVPRGYKNNISRVNVDRLNG